MGVVKQLGDAAAPTLIQLLYKPFLCAELFCRSLCSAAMQLPHYRYVIHEDVPKGGPIDV